MVNNTNNILIVQNNTIRHKTPLYHTKQDYIIIIQHNKRQHNIVITQKQHNKTQNNIVIIKNSIIKHKTTS